MSNARKRRWPLMIAVVAAPLVAWAAIATHRHTDDQRQAGAVVRALAAVKPGDVLMLEQVVGVPWDDVLIAGPYAGKENVRRATGDRLPADLDGINLDDNEGQYVLIFLRKSGPSNAVAVRRNVAEFDDQQLMRTVPRARARLVREASGVLFAWQSS